MKDLDLIGCNKLNIDLMDTLSEKGLFAEIGDIIFHNSIYFEIDNVKQDQMLIW